MKTKLLILATVFFVTLAANAEARQFNGNGQAACITENMLDQIIDAARENNQQAMNYLLSNGCFIPKAGIDVTVLDAKFNGKAQVRVYLDGQPIELWTVGEALAR